MERRQFLKLGATATGGMILGLHLPQSRAAGVAEEPVQMNAWIRIDPDNRITFICHRNEMGQDVHTSLAMLVAEELQVPVASLGIEQAPVAAVYTNAMIGAQITGGSTSIRDAWLPLPPPNRLPRGLAVGDRVDFEFYVDPTDGPTVTTLTLLPPAAPAAAAPGASR